MWMVPAGWLCREHLLGEHSEMHQAAGTLANHEHGEAVVRGLAEESPLDTGLIRQRHAELAVELERRGHDHDSPLQGFEDPGVGSFGAADVRANADELALRCAGCRARRASDPHRAYRLGARARLAEHRAGLRPGDRD
jgi:hypothetical protein